jgi:hypothetical protein
MGYNTYIHKWKCHKETPYIAILNKNVFFYIYTKSENWKVEQVLWGEGGGTSGGGRRKKAWEGEYSANTVYTCM